MQIVVPKQYRSQVICMAHSSPISAHFSENKTKQEILRDFFWPGLGAEVKNMCHTCEDCQK